MVKTNTTNFNMKLTDTEKEIMDFVTEVIHGGRYSKADLVIELFKQQALDYLDLPEEAIGIYDEVLLSALKKKKMDEDITMVSMVGVEQYKKLIKDYKEKYGENSAEYLEACLAEYERLQNGGEPKNLFGEV
jgi:hypothetical protein